MKSDCKFRRRRQELKDQMEDKVLEGCGLFSLEGVTGRLGTRVREVDKKLYGRFRV